MSQKRQHCVLLLRNENIFVYWCCVGSDRVAGVGVSLGTLDLVRVDGRPCLGWCSHTTISRLRLSDRPLVLKDRLGPSTIRAAVRRRVLGFFSGARLRAHASAILEALSRTNCRALLQGHLIQWIREPKAYQHKCAKAKARAGNMTGRL